MIKDPVMGLWEGGGGFRPILLTLLCGYDKFEFSKRGGGNLRMTDINYILACMIYERHKKQVVLLLSDF